MATKNQVFLVNPASGGLDATTSPALVPTGSFVVADNVQYSLSGGKQKRPGTSRYNATTIGATSVIGVIADFWRHGASVAGTQKFVCISEDTIYKDDGDGVWDVVEAAWSAANREATQNIVIAQGYAIFSDGTAAPRKWDQTTDSPLANAPVFEFGSYHLRRLFTSGIAANPSRIDYCAAGDVETWTGADAGNFIFDEDDGDRVMGVSKAFRGRMFIFKGPNTGSVHFISGTTPSNFQRQKLFEGAPCVNHKSVITTPNDIYWASRYGFHSLTATEKYGDAEEAYLSRPIQLDFDRLVMSRMNQVCGFHHPRRNIIGWAATGPGATENDTVFVYNYILQAWSVWKFSGFGPASLAVMQEPASGGDQRLPKLFIGGYNGFLYKGDNATFSDDNGNRSYNFRLRTPAHYRLSELATEVAEKQFYRTTTFYRPTGAFNATLQTSIDGRTQSNIVSMSGGGDLIGSTFVIGTSVISPAAQTDFRETILNDIGRGIQMEWSSSEIGRDIEIYGYAITYGPAESMAQERSNA